MERILLALLSCLAFAATIFCLRHRSPLHLALLLGIFTLLAGNFFPIATLFIEPLSWRNIVQAPEADVLAVQADYVAFAAGIAVAAILAFATGCLSHREDPAPARRAVRSDLLVATALVLVGGALYAFYIQKVGFEALTSRDNYAEKYLRSVGLGPFASGINVMIAGVLWAEVGHAEPRIKLVFRAVAIAIAMWSLGVIAVRTNLVILGLGYAWILCARRGLTIRTTRPALVLAAVLGWSSLELISLWRGAVQEAGSGRAAELLVQNVESNLAAVVGGSEMSHPFLTALEVRMSEHEGELGGSSYWNAFPALAPLALVPDRPMALAETFARTHYAEMAELGGGTAFSLVAEAWWNFGNLAGSFVVGLLSAALLLVLEVAALSGTSPVLARTLPYFAFLCVIAHRSESAVLLKQTVSIALPIALIVVIADLLQPVLERRNGRALPASSH